MPLTTTSAADKLSKRQLPDAQQPAGRCDETAVHNRLPSERSQVLPDQNSEARSAHADVSIHQLVRLFNQERLAIRRFEMKQVVRNLLKPVQRVVFSMGEVHVGLQATMAHEEKHHIESDQ
jgi:hypothetical protein